MFDPISTPILLARNMRLIDAGAHEALRANSEVRGSGAVIDNSCEYPPGS